MGAPQVLLSFSGSDVSIYPLGLSRDSRSFAPQSSVSHLNSVGSFPAEEEEDSEISQDFKKNGKSKLY